MLDSSRQGGGRIQPRRWTGKSIGANGPRAFGRQQLEEAARSRAAIGQTTTPTGIKLPRLRCRDSTSRARSSGYLWRGSARRISFVERRLSARCTCANVQRPRRRRAATEEPTRLFAGLGLAEDTNARFHFLTSHQHSVRLSTAFDGPTLYGLDSDADGVFGKIGEGGVAIDTVEDMDAPLRRLRSRATTNFSRLDDHQRPGADDPGDVSSPRPSGASARTSSRKLRGTVQADMLKEVQAQNEMLFPIDASLRFLTDMVEYTHAAHAALVSDLDQRLPHRRGRRHAGAAGGVHAVQRLRLRRACSASAGWT